MAVIEINLKQLGGGEPSPDNIRPIVPGVFVDGIGGIYGGTLDVTNGSLSVTHRIWVFDGAESWGAETTSSGQKSFYLNLNRYSLMQDRETGALSAQLKINEFRPVVASTSGTAYISGGGYLNVRYSGTETASGFKAFLQSSPLTIAYPLAETIVCQLTKTQVHSVCAQTRYPYLDYLGMITDRTQSDVDDIVNLLRSGMNPADHKGAYNASDLNRVGEAVSYLADRMKAFGLKAVAEPKTDWEEADIPLQSQIGIYLESVRAVRDAIRAYIPDADLPKDMRRLSYIGANQIEMLLKRADLTMTRIELSYRGYSGRLTSGVNCLP